jgi:hypothetical protein
MICGKHNAKSYRETIENSGFIEQANEVWRKGKLIIMQYRASTRYAKETLEFLKEKCQIVFG